MNSTADFGRRSFEPSRLVLAAALSLGGLLLVLAIRSLGWRMNQDAPTLFYGAYLAQVHGLVPYRDFFELNGPGAHLAYAAFGALAGHAGGLPLRLLDLAWLAALLALGGCLVRPFGPMAGAAAGALGGLLYLGGGDYWSLQREAVLLLPVLAAYALAARAGGRAPLLVVAGLALGAAGAVKPQVLVLGLPLLVTGLPVGRLGAEELFPATEPVGWRAIGRAAVALATGVALAWGAVAAWLAAVGALTPFLEMAREYWPLYNSLTGRPYRALSGHEHVAVAALGTVTRLWSRYGAWGLLALAGARLAWVGADPGQRRTLAQLGGLALAALLLPGIAVKFWSYHWLPFGFAAMLLVAAGVGAAAHGPAARRWCGLALLGAAAASLPTEGWRNSPRGAPLLDRVDAVVAALSPRLAAGDRVQPLDRSGAALHAMLLLEARIATPYLEDTVFYHHAERPWVVRQRQLFVAALRASPPRYVIDLDEPGWAEHPDSGRPYPALGVLLAERYQVLARFEGGTVLARRASPGQE